MSKRELKALEASVVNLSQWLKLRSGMTAQTETIEAGQKVETLAGAGAEATVMAEQAVNEKDEKIESRTPKWKKCGNNRWRSYKKLTIWSKSLRRCSNTNAETLVTELKERLSVDRKHAETEARDLEGQL